MSNYTIQLIDAGSVGKYYILRKCKLLTSELEQADRQHAKKKLHETLDNPLNYGHKTGHKPSYIQGF